MKRVSTLILIVLVSSVVSYFLLRAVKDKVQKDLSQPIAYPSVEVAPTLKVQKAQNETLSLFVPYWTLNTEVSEQEAYDEYIYFGITPDIDGIDRNEAGYTGIGRFLEDVPQDSKKILTLRMIDKERNLAILKNPTLHKKIISETISTAQEHGFEGIALDLELSAIPFDSLIQQINAFTKAFYQQAKERDVSFAIVIYGDTFYRIRPFDVKTLSKNADRFYIMAYDFHKSKGNPGPNFPLRGKDVYGYDMTKMVEDFLQYVPPQKLVVIFGLFGYDWEVDGNGKATSQGEPLTYNQINNTLLKTCAFEACDKKRKNDSLETEIRYKDEDGRPHVVWFEDMESLGQKKTYLKEKGISSFSFWANSYF